MQMSIDTLQMKIRKLKNPSMLTLAPTPEWIPPYLLEEKLQAMGSAAQALAAAYEAFCTGILDALADTVPAVILYGEAFHALGADGTQTLQNLSHYAAQKGYYVLLDAMHGGAGVEFCTQALFEGISIGGEVYQPYVVDAVTINAYAGSDSVKPFLPYCKKTGKNLFVQVKTHNKSAHELQDLLSGDRVVYTAVADMVERWSGGAIGNQGYSEIAITAGASDADALRRLRATYEQLFILVTGYGTSRDSGKNVQYAFDQLGHGAIVADTGTIAAAWIKANTDGRDYCEQAEQAALKMKNDILKFVVIR